MTLTIWQVDAFADRPFAGNPAAVCILPEARDAAWMQAVAREMNLSETAFLVPKESGFDLRWFTPAVEVDLCGHATVASAHVLWEEGFLRPEETARFDSRSGPLAASRDGDWIELDFPAQPPASADAPPGLAEALGAEVRYTGRTEVDLVIEVASEEVVRGMWPDMAAIKSMAPRGLAVTARASTAPYDYVCRFFGPAAGIDEDPVTGSAQCALGPYWQEQLGKDELLGYQASARGGTLRVRPRGERVLIAGKAVTVLKGELRG